MSDRSSFPFRCVRNPSESPGMSQAIEEDLFRISRAAAGTVRPGATVKEQLIAAWENLGRPPMWRLRSAWWRDGSRDWSARAVHDFQQRFIAWRDREAARVAERVVTEALVARQRDAAALKAARDDHRRALAALELRLALLGDEEDA